MLLFLETLYFDLQSLQCHQHRKVLLVRFLPEFRDYHDLGSFERSIATTSREEQLWFNRGLNCTFAFNHEEAVACYEKLIAQDAPCTMQMGYWGVAHLRVPSTTKLWLLSTRQT